MKNYLLIHHIKIHNANALSSPYSIGFPAMTAWLGAVHALQRSIQQNGMTEVFLAKVAVTCHDFKLHTYRGNDSSDYLIIGTANPLKKKGSEYQRPPFIPEARCDLEVSLLVEVTGINADNEKAFLDHVHKQLYRMKMASGDILSVENPKIIYDGEKQVRACIRQLMPGYVLIERRDLMMSAMECGKDALDALLDYLKVMYQSNPEEKVRGKWSRTKKVQGWIVPIAVGFHGISELGNAKNQRDEKTTHRFAESVVTLGEFKMPYRFQSLDEMMWSYSTDLAQGLYVCKNQQ